MAKSTKRYLGCNACEWIGMIETIAKRHERLTGHIVDVISRSEWTRRRSLALKVSKSNRTKFKAVVRRALRSARDEIRAAREQLKIGHDSADNVVREVVRENLLIILVG